ncbi:hypothetical protein LTR85_009437 [Meristemomyces frigidus]|nr:hypothetical protein LTR85_009437 [Meristemomyces frigidus]
MRRASVRSDVAADHGRYIYAYCHVRTNQVVYSLTQTLNNHSSLKQLPDLGANNKDARLRKDLWKPLYTLCLPSDSPHTLSQGLHAFKKLREYRKLHEVNWTPSPLLSKPKTEAEIQQMKDKLSDRGGNKKENVYDLIVREKKRMRVKSVMDQKANSVADLAAVLIGQEELGAVTGEAREKEKRADRKKEVEEMLALAAEAEGGALEALEKELAGLQSRMENLEMDQRDEDGLTRTALKREMWQLMSRKLRMEFASNAVKDARDPARRQTAQEQKPASQPRASVLRPVTEEDFLRKSHANRAKMLLNLAKEAEQGGFAKLDRKIADWQQHIDTYGEEEGKFTLSQVHGFKLSRRHMELASEAAVNPSRSGNLRAEVDGVRRKMAEYKIELLGEELKAAEELAFPERVESLQQALETSRRNLEALQATGFLPGERERAAEKAAVQSSRRAEERLEDDASAAEAVEPEPEVQPQAAESTTPAGEIDYMTVLPSFPGRSADRIPKRGHLRQKLLRLNSPVFSTEGVTVKWHNILDAEFAEAWPENVQHERMGWSRYTAPKGNTDAPAIEDVSEFKELQWRNREANWLPAPEEEVEGEAALQSERGRFEREARKEFVRGIREDILRRVRAKEEERREAGRAMAGLEGMGGVEQRVSV